MKKYKEILKQHKDLEIAFDRLGIVAASPQGIFPEKKIKRVLQHELAALKKRLASHFAFEEEGGYLEVVTTKRPNLSNQVLELKSQHEKINLAVESLHMCSLKEEKLEKLKADILTTLDVILKHEQTEGELLQTALYEDVGAGD